MSKITKGIQDKETFTRTKCTSTVLFTSTAVLQVSS